MESPELQIFVSKDLFYINYVMKLREDGRIFYKPYNERDSLVRAVMNSMGYYSRVINIISISLEKLFECEKETLVSGFKFNEAEIRLIFDFIVRRFAHTIAHEYLHYCIFEAEEDDGINIGGFKMEGVIDWMLGD